MTEAPRSPDPAPAESTAPRSRGRLASILGSTFSPHGLLTWAATITLAFLICHLAGLRESTTIICGTSPSGDPQDYAGAYLGVMYVITYGGVTIAVPALLIASALLAAAFGLPFGTRSDSRSGQSTP